MPPTSTIAAVIRANIEEAQHLAGRLDTHDPRERYEVATHLGRLATILADWSAFAATEEQAA